MKKIIKMLWITLCIGISSSALAGPDGDMGTVVGGVAGGMLGNSVGHGSGRTAATIGGAVVGSLVGSNVGTSMDRTEQDRRSPNRYGHWESHHYPDYSRYPSRYRDTFIHRDGRLCRHSVSINEYGDRVYSTLCCEHVTPNGYCTRWIRVR
jgi:Glycine zipper 2TM domain